ncbi:MAG: hypothetical protein ACRD2L_09245 [Terriglobia bacterium]
MNSARLDGDHGWRAILLASLAKVTFKSFIVITVGQRQLFARIVPLFALVLLAGVAMLFLWPAVG